MNVIFFGGNFESKKNGNRKFQLQTMPKDVKGLREAI